MKAIILPISTWIHNTDKKLKHILLILLGEKFQKTLQNTQKIKSNMGSFS
jgi:hypothetical protein